ncbi:chromodomain-helicase-DNA-binding protein 8 isoform X2 [Rhinatrema bivittatum]|uniref:chromodomain-helicase-DNA-binding protein 8 isoform X2 n=1 Tax=Rhinatrema bivittatum TaxID=194408 RepID=UPI00112BAAF8|nr:chromodomain-helicase-DNA-binding protein 8 isoform X2 [Rhinatrema bivittatum]
MADPIMDLFDDPNLFGLDSLTEEAFGQSGPDPMDDALGLTGILDPLGQLVQDSGVLLKNTPPEPPAPQPPPPLPAAPESLILHDYTAQPANPQPAPAIQIQPGLIQLTKGQEVLEQGNPFMGVSAGGGGQPQAQKIVILKAPAGMSVAGQPLTLGSTQSANGGKVTFAKVLTGTPLRPGVSIVSGNAVLAAKLTTGPGGAQRVVQASRPVKQMLLQPLKSQVTPGNTAIAGSGGVALKPGVTLTSSPAQGESKRITLVLQQPSQMGAGGQMGPRHLVLGSLPGKIVLQGTQLAALTQAKNTPGQPPKVVTIQLQVQQPPQQQEQQPQKIQILQQAPAQPLMVSSAATQAVPQRLALPLKVVLQPQAGSSQGGSPGLSVVKVLTASEAAVALSSSAPSGRQESRKLEHQKKQEKANRIVAEAIARARARGEQNIPRVLNEDELPTLRLDEEGERKKRKNPRGGGGSKEEKLKKPKVAPGSSKSKNKSKASTITPIVGKKRKRNASSDNSDVELMPAQSSPQEEDESSIQKRRSNRQVKRKKYTEDLDIRITDDEEEEEVDVTGPVRPEPLLLPEVPPESEVLPSMQFFVENPSEEDAAIVDKILSMRVVKKELPSGLYIEAEEFFVKYKNYSYLHCEWATIEQLERDKRIHQKLKRFKAKMAQMRHFLPEDEEPFNPDYVEVDRILDESHSIDKDNGEPVIYYLVKWCSLPYEDSTWELKEDVEEGKIEEFKRIQSRQPDLKRVVRPASTSWRKLELSREYRNGNQLREYQLEGVNWLLFNWYNRQNCILADEMGLGKTIQSITFLQEVYSVGLRGPFLVIAPLSTITNWEREFSGWTKMNTIVYHGSLASRQMIQQYEMYCKDSKGRLIPGAYKFDALITTFEMVLSDCPELREIEWRCVIIDEAHRLKNRNCKLLDSLKHMDLEHKVLLTGTPLQNTVEELFSLLHFLEPSQFPSESEFLKDFGDLKTEEQVQKLQAILKPMMLRRLKEDVEKNLAPKQETIIEVELTNIQKKYYRAILEKNFSFLSKGAGQSNMPNLLNTMMELRKCCNHPYLINGAEEKILLEFREARHPAVPLDYHLQAMVRSAGKLVLIDKLLPKLKTGGHKVLIFSQMVRCLDILEDYLIQKRYLYERIDGRVRGNLRQAAIDRFSKPDSDRFVFLLCTRAGGLGINLTAADTCIIFDSDWNPQNDLQAQARCHRIGQSKAVKVYRLITRNSYERDMFDKASLKLGLDKAVLQSMSGRENITTGIQPFTKKEIEDLLRKGAYAAIMDEDDEGSKFCEEDIDQILLRRTTTITIESEGKGSTFAKASFVASENRTDISLDDPNFWQKWAKKADIDVDSINSKNTLVIDTPRVRKQTRHFSTLRDDDMVEFSDLDSEDEERPRHRRHERHHGYGRTDCFRVEKHLLVYGWGRWKDILSHGRFKRRMSERDVETICRAILVYCLLHYRGDDKIKSFIWDLITPAENGKTKQLQNHTGLSIPVPRGRKGKKVKSQSSFDMHKADWIRKYNPDTLFQDESYKKHLKHQCNKVLLRVRMLYYLRQEVIGDQAARVLSGADARDIDIWFPEVDQLEVPTDWWTSEADKSLLFGVFKHGYEKYNTMRADAALCFLEKVGRPDEKAIAAEHRVTDSFPELGEGVDFDKDCEDPEYKPLQGMAKYPEDEGDPLMMDEEISVVDNEEVQPPLPGRLLWPPGSALTARLRRLITAYQRTYKRELMKIEAAERGDRRRRRCEAAFKLKEMARQEKQQRWTRREQSDFYRVVSTFGIVYDPDTHQYNWDRFRTFARLDKKMDASLTKYFHGFVAMCRQVCRLPPAAGDELPDHTLFIEPISEERASRALYRLELLRRLREQVLCHPLLLERLSLCPPAPELPEWWECPRHDGELLRGAARHGLARLDCSVMQDPTLSFLSARAAHELSRGPLLPLHHQYTALQAAPEQVVGQGWGPPVNPAATVKKEPSAGCGEESDSELDLGKLSPSSSSSSSSSAGSSDESEDEKAQVDGLTRSTMFDEESPLSLNTSQDGFPNEDSEQAASELLPEQQRVAEWPKDRVLINRIDLVSQAVLTGKWPVQNWAAETGTHGPHPGAHSTEFSGSPAPASWGGSMEEDSGSASQFTKLRRGTDEKEFTVQIKDEEGLKLTFQKQRLLVNGGALPDGHLLFHKKKGGQKKAPEVEVEIPDEPLLSELDLDARIPVMNQLDGTVLVGEEAPRRRELHAWLRTHLHFAVDPRFLAYMEKRQKQKQHRCKKPSKTSQGGFSGLERMQAGGEKNSKKSRCPEASLSHSHQDPALTVSSKNRSKRPPSQDPPRTLAPGTMLAAGPHAATPLHGFRRGPLPSARVVAPPPFPRPLLLHSPGLRGLGYPLPCATTTRGEPQEEPDELSQSYKFSLLHDPMMPANSDSSEEDDDEED